MYAPYSYHYLLLINIAEQIAKNLSKLTQNVSDIEMQTILARWDYLMVHISIKLLVTTEKLNYIDVEKINFIDDDALVCHDTE